MACILVNAIVMGLTWYPFIHKLDEATTAVNYVFTMYFFLEMTVKLVCGRGRGLRSYLHVCRPLPPWSPPPVTFLSRPSRNSLAV